MKIIVSILLTALLGFALSIFFPWWIIALAAFVVAFAIPQTPWKALLTGFLGIFLLWSLLAWWISTANDDLLANKISMLLLKQQSAGMLILVSGLIGGLVGAAAALTGSLARKL
ncbi:hypothetical protein [Flavihumibacter petaseus]|uniref:Uncharacterized protein n=1 Tax=Flavihumibacter petaseus NBRC 106054 TaxID=1220578 RepID=A0A0E9N4A8_9BACT|nr:hypothetical protein [Flavihumibacter petaseus]GAO44491.1 hypothetical protein FPE01S_03_05280 [Flavihumibacter petaseus NBRC 106054]